MSPTQSAIPTAASTGSASPGTVPSACVPTYVTTPRNTHAATMPVTCAASFSRAIRRLPNGAAATMSKLPRRASEARVPDRATIAQRPAISPKKGPYFQDR